MNQQEQTRARVGRAYAEAAGRAAGSCCAEPVPEGVAAKLAGYDPGEIAALPPDAVSKSFGCGNPVAFAGLKPGQTVLDLGSGAGIDILLAAKHVGPEGRVIGVDMTEVMIEKAKANIAAAKLDNVEVRKGIIEQLPVESESVDWVISNCVINLSPDKPRVFSEIARVLKPGGCMVVSDIVVEDLPQWVRDSEALYCSCVAGAVSETEYVAALQAAGLEDVQVGDRFVYDGDHLKGLIASEVSPGSVSPGSVSPGSVSPGSVSPGSVSPGDASSEWCCNVPVELDVDASAAGLTGKIASVRFHARKPAR